MNAEPHNLGPVEYSVAVERYLDAADLSPASRRVYRIALHAWGWLIVDRLPPTGAQRRGAVAPIVPLARLEGSGAAARLRAARDCRAVGVDTRTLNRELSILRGALTWWAERGWLSENHEAQLSAVDVSAIEDMALSNADVNAVFALRASLREQTCWNLLYESAAPIERLLALDIGDLDLVHRATKRHSAQGPKSSLPPLTWRSGTARLLPFLLAGRYSGPVFLTDRRTSVNTPQADRCPVSGRGRLSYRRAAELFQDATKPLDPAGRGWALRQLRLAGRNENQNRNQNGNRSASTTAAVP